MVTILRYYFRTLHMALCSTLSSIYIAIDLIEVNLQVVSIA